MNQKAAIACVAYVVIQYLYFIVSGLILKKKSLELEGIGFFLTAIGMAVVASVNPGICSSRLPPL